MELAAVSNRQSSICTNFIEVSADKEQWEPVITTILAKTSTEIDEAWAIDWQNHGQSALLNKETLKHRDPVGKPKFYCF